MAGLSPTQRTLKYYKDLDCFTRIGQVERWIPGRNIRKDYLDIIDFIALDPATGVVGIQSTGQDFAGHLRKLTEEKADNTRAWLETPGTSLILIGWRKIKVKRGGKAMKWEPRIKHITLEDLK